MVKKLGLAAIFVAVLAVSSFVARAKPPGTRGPGMPAGTLGPGPATPPHRSPDHAYRTMNLAGIFVRERGLFMKAENKGRFYHDGRFQTRLDVVKSYKDRFGLDLSDQDERDLVEYLKSL